MGAGFGRVRGVALQPGSHSVQETRAERGLVLHARTVGPYDDGRARLCAWVRCRDGAQGEVDLDDFFGREPAIGAEEDTGLADVLYHAAVPLLLTDAAILQRDRYGIAGCADRRERMRFFHTHQGGG